jgi:hypothetical protein
MTDIFNCRQLLLLSIALDAIFRIRRLTSHEPSITRHKPPNAKVSIAAYPLLRQVRRTSIPAIGVASGVDAGIGAYTRRGR